MFFGMRIGPFFGGSSFGGRKATYGGYCGVNHRSALASMSCSRCATVRNMDNKERILLLRERNVELVQRAEALKTEKARMKAESKAKKEAKKEAASQAKKAKKEAAPQQAPQAGWYSEPTGGAGLRWWDGVKWTSYTQPRAPKASPGPRDWTPSSWV